MSCDDANFHECASDKAMHLQSASSECGRGSYRSSGSRDMLLPNVFVQIPANHGPTTKIPVSRHYEEIKAEPPIKSEIENILQQSVAGQRFVNKDVDGTSGSEQFARDCFADANATTSTPAASTSLVTARPKSTTVKCFKCTLCPFMSISQSGYDGHIANVHVNQSEREVDADHLLRKKILCPGCENVFYSKKSLKIHLANDHQMSALEIVPLLESLFAQSDSKGKRSTVRKQKIYLKNVENLKNPQFSSSQFALHENVGSTPIGTPANDANVMPSTGEYLFVETHLNGELSAADGNRVCDLIDDLEPSYSFTDLTSVAGSVSSVSDSVAITSDDTMSVRPDSGNSIKYCDNSAMTSCDGWINGNGAHFQNYEQQPMSNWNFISENQSVGHSTSPMPLTTSSTTSATTFNGVCQNEKKKIFIKNIDILKEPLITPATSLSADSASGRKHMLHLRTVDEVNLMLSNKVENEGNGYLAPTSEVITLDEDDYRYVLNDGVDYNSTMIPPCFENDMNDLVSNLLTTPDYMPNYTTPSAYVCTGQESVASAVNVNEVIVLDMNAKDATLVTEQQHRNGEQLPMALHDRSTNVDSGHHVIDYDFMGNKLIPQRTMDGPEYMIVSSDGIIDAADDILDLTNDEVDQIIDHHLIGSQCFDGFPPVAHESTPQTNKARINVVGNLMRPDFTGAADDPAPFSVDRTNEAPHTTEDDACAQPPTGDSNGHTKKRSGRPKGARKTYGVASKAEALPYKCRVGNCAMRFASENVLAIHEQCHDTTDAYTEFRCPKCEAAADDVPKKWTYNTLATHLWRKHSVDLELYSCTHPDCNFKTPMLSRLTNTHMKIHSDAKDFKCDQCDKAFKNTKQLKNHRRIHSKMGPIQIRKCPHCDQSFTSQHIKTHIKTHLLSNAAPHVAAESMPRECEEYKCGECSYQSFDRNAFRRHKMVHSKQVKYKCPLCAYQAIQTANYKTHIIKKHPDAAKDLIFMCEKCNFATVSQHLFYVHCLNHNAAFAC